MCGSILNNVIGPVFLITKDWKTVISSLLLRDSIVKNAHFVPARFSRNWPLYKLCSSFVGIPV